MNEKEMRSLLRQVIEDLDAGRIQAPRGRLRALGRRLGPPLLAAGIGLGLAACEARAIGAEGDAGVRPDAVARVDATIAPAYGIPWLVDAGPMPEYAEPFLDAGPTLEYMAPFIDAGPLPDAGDDFALYSAPPIERDGGLVPAYGVPGCEPPSPDDDPDEDPA